MMEEGQNLDDSAIINSAPFTALPDDVLQEICSRIPLSIRLSCEDEGWNDVIGRFGCGKQYWFSICEHFFGSWAVMAEMDERLFTSSTDSLSQLCHQPPILCTKLDNLYLDVRAGNQYLSLIPTAQHVGGKGIMLKVKNLLTGETQVLDMIKQKTYDDFTDFEFGLGAYFTEIRLFVVFPGVSKFICKLDGSRKRIRGIWPDKFIKWSRAAVVGNTIFSARFYWTNVIQLFDFVSNRFSSIDCPRGLTICPDSHMCEYRDSLCLISSLDDRCISSWADKCFQVWKYDDHTWTFLWKYDPLPFPWAPKIPILQIGDTCVMVSSKEEGIQLYDFKSKSVVRTLEFPLFHITWGHDITFHTRGSFLRRLTSPEAQIEVVGKKTAVTVAVEEDD